MIAVEFIYAQSPAYMKGILLRLLFGTEGIAIGFAAVFNLAFTRILETQTFWGKMQLAVYKNKRLYMELGTQEAKQADITSFWTLLAHNFRPCCVQMQVVSPALSQFTDPNFVPAFTTSCCDWVCRLVARDEKMNRCSTETLE